MVIVHRDLTTARQVQILQAGDMRQLLHHFEQLTCHVAAINPLVVIFLVTRKFYTQDRQ